MLRAAAAVLFLALAAPASAANWIDPQFSDASHGSIIRDDTVLVTANGGTTWKRLPRARYVVPNPTGPWLGVRGRTLRRGTPATTHWPVVGRLPRAPLDIVVRGSGAWALTVMCRSCHLRLWHSFDAGRTWWWQTLRDSSPDFDKYSMPKLAFADAADGVVTYLAGHDTVRRYTRDGGHTWSSAARVGDCWDQRPSVGDDGSIWLGCQTSPSGSLLTHQVFSSTDGGRHFVLRNPGRHQFTVPSPSIYGTAAVSASTAYAEIFKGGVFRTTDGGTHWRPLHPFPFGDGAEYAGLTAAGGWVWEAHIGAGLYASADGGRHWRHTKPRP